MLKKPGRDLRDRIEFWLAWRRVHKEVLDGTLGADYDRADRAEIQANVGDAEEAAKDEVWGGYRFVVPTDSKEKDGIRIIDLGAGHASGSETLCGRVLAALKSNALLNESVGAGYVERNWPPALKESGAWPLSSLRQSFLNGSLTRLVDPDAVLKMKIVEFVSKGDFGLASGSRPNGSYDRVWYEELISPDEVVFEADVFLLTKAKAKQLKGGARTEPVSTQGSVPVPQPQPPLGPVDELVTVSTTKTIRLVGSVPPEVWNRIGTKLIPKLRAGREVKLGVELVVTLDGSSAQNFESELRQILEDLGLSQRIRIEKGE